MSLSFILWWEDLDQEQGKVLKLINCTRRCLPTVLLFSAYKVTSLPCLKWFIQLIRLLMSFISSDTLKTAAQFSLYNYDSCCLSTWKHHWVGAASQSSSKFPPCSSCRCCDWIAGWEYQIEGNVPVWVSHPRIFNGNIMKSCQVCPLTYLTTSKLLEWVVTINVHWP